MIPEKIEFKPVTPIPQTLEKSCVPASVSMILSGFGVNVSENELIDRYFQNAKKSVFDQNAGASEADIVRGMVESLKDEGLSDRLQLSVLDPYLWVHTNPQGDRYLQLAQPGDLRRAKKNHEDPRIKEFYSTLEKLVKPGGARVYTANSKLMQLNTNRARSFDQLMPEVYRNIQSNFLNELIGFVKKGHSIGIHGGMTSHARVLDGYLSGLNRSWIVDPRGESFEMPLKGLFWVEPPYLRGDFFDYIFRIAPKEEDLSIQPTGFKGFLNRFRT